MVVSASAQAGQLRILAFGDSLTAGAGVTAEDSLPAQLKRRLVADGFDIEMINAGVSGDTTAGGLARLDYTLSAGPVDMAIVELGANDMLTGVDPKKSRANLDQIISMLRSKGVTVMLAAMVSSANWGQAYKQDFDSIYPDLAKKHGVTMIPFFLEGVWGHPALLVDGVHPNAAGVARIVSKITPQIEKVLTSMGATRLASPK
ncbi:arylesterase [Methylocystis sp. WRRC1]|uniref:arylesterase n=1 Tax=Methylocystis sp. WRRC1 TaxID=1732014 RepID=UPI001D1574A6|nr:arylesterase [Methylocystis sp. WRRC1]MCC3243881.1 arylesterase [Methylocystis sp. WRRC1]